MTRYCFGVDVGGTSIKMGFFTEEGILQEKWSIPTNLSEKGTFIIPEIAQAIMDKLKEKQIELSQVLGIGVGVPGPVSQESVVQKCVNLGWDIVDVAKELKALTGLKVKVGNDANVAALGEMFGGSGKGSSSIVMVTLGTGVGGGVIIDGQILNGTNGAAGEIGHIEMSSDETEYCGCGKRGCLEQYASATGIVRMTKKVLEEKSYPSGMDTKLELEKLSAKYIFDLAKAGDEVAQFIAEETAKYLGIALAQIACIVNPEVFVIGGGMATAGDYLVEMIQKHYKDHAFHAAKNGKFILASLGNDAGIYGCAKLALTRGERR